MLHEYVLLADTGLILAVPCGLYFVNSVSEVTAAVIILAITILYFTP